MMALNHAVTGAIVGLSVENPAVAMPLAFMSHFALDAIPHYDYHPPRSNDNAEIYRSKRFLFEQLIVNGLLCVMLVVALALAHPKYWLSAAICAFLATSPDLMWVPRYLSALKTGKDIPPRTAIARFHGFVQWSVGPKLLWVELVWLTITATILARLI